MKSAAGYLPPAAPAASLPAVCQLIKQQRGRFLGHLEHLGVPCHHLQCGVEGWHGRKEQGW